MGKVVDGSSQREHLEKLAQKGHKTAIEKLDGPGLPYALTYLWVWFLQVSAGRASSEGGLSGISYQDILAWSTLMDTSPVPHEVDALMQVDVAYRNANSKDD